MIRNILTKLTVVLLVAVLIHSVFWFFKTGQLEKNVNNFVAENSGNVSVGSVSVSGYPIAQRVVISDLHFVIPNSALNKNKIIVQKLEMTSGIFANNFEISIIDDVLVKDSDGNSRKVEFNRSPVISLAIDGGDLADFSYQDSGYRIFDEEKNLIYSALSSDVSIKSSVNEVGEITSKINVNIKEMEGFDVVDIYKNSFEKMIVEGIKTGNISVGDEAKSVEKDLQMGEDFQQLAQNSDLNSEKPKVLEKSMAVAGNKKIVVDVVKPKIVADSVDIMAKESFVADNSVADVKVAKDSVVPKDKVEKPVQNDVVKKEIVAQNLAKIEVNSVKQTNVGEENVANDVENLTQDIAKQEMPSPEIAENIEENIEEDPTSVVDKIEQVLAKNDIIKRNLFIDLEYILTPNKNEDQDEMPLDPSKLQVVATQYSRSFKINVIETSNSLYKISFNGQLNYFQDDNMPSGFVTVKVEKIENLVNYLKESFQKIASKDKSELQSFDASNLAEVSQDAYRNFLNKVSDNLSQVTYEIAAKNTLSEKQVAVFDMRREKNLDFVVNDTSLREILGKL